MVYNMLNFFKGEFSIQIRSLYLFLNFIYSILFLSYYKLLKRPFNLFF